MPGGDLGDQTHTSTRIRRRLPEDLVNPDGVYSGAARRNAFEDGEFFPGTEGGKEINTGDDEQGGKRKRKRYDD
jgi:hypothetical protein